LILSFNHLIDYTDWEREKWREWLRQHGDDVLKISLGPHGDGRFQVIGDVLRHIFSAEKRYVERLSGKSLTDTSSIPNDKIETLFEFGETSRTDLKHLLLTLPENEWDLPSDHKIVNHTLRLTPRKIVTHILLHEIRHWAQIATLFRLNGLAGDFHDFLFSPVLGAKAESDVANA
jgi:uncharacterized damage-inducible protein DinB